MLPIIPIYLIIFTASEQKYTYDGENLNLRNISNELSTVKHKQYEIGIQLGIPRHNLEEFKKERDALSASIDYWLKENVEEVPVTWQSIVNALTSPHVDERGLAQRIAKKYCLPTEKG